MQIKLDAACPAILGKFKQPSRYKALYGGRGGAKSQFFAGLLVANASQTNGFSAACFREVQKSIRSSVKKLIDTKIQQMGVSDLFDIKNDFIRTPGGGEIVFSGLQDHTADSIKSYENFQLAWIEEGQSIAARSWELLRPTIRAPKSEIWVSWNPRSATDPIDEFFRGPNPPDNAIVEMINHDDNEFFPPELEEERLHDFKHNPVRYAHIWLGEYEPQVVGAIFDRRTMHDNRIDEVPSELDHIVVAIDPAVSSEAGADEHGIIVAGEADGVGYVLEDATISGAPRQWANMAIAMLDKWDADTIIIERNQGGDMCRFTLESVRPDLNITEVHATRGKHVRAEPISAQYHLGRIKHVGSFPELEGQLCQITNHGYEGEGSPDRADALVWAMTHLFPEITERRVKKRKGPEVNIGWMG